MTTTTTTTTTSSFYTIIQKHLDVPQILIPSGNCHQMWADINLHNISDLIRIFFYQYITSLFLKSTLRTCSIKNKFNMFKHMIDNVFIKELEELKEEMLDLFCKIQKTYYGFSRFAYIYKYKKSQYVIKNDLYLNEIDECKTNVYTLYQDKSKYLFMINDLINIINNNLSNSPNFFVSPKISKNPYNNMPLTHASLYNIYFFIKNRNGIIPELFHHFFMCNFNISLFAQKYECIIRNTAIKNFVNLSSIEILYPNIQHMLRVYAKKIRIHKEFPKEKLLNIMRPYLQLYYLEKFAITGSGIKYESKTELEDKLRLFVKFNPHFGRKYIHFLSKPIFIFQNDDANLNNKRKRFPSITTFNDKHISFNETLEELNIMSVNQHNRQHNFNEILNLVLHPVEIHRFNRYYVIYNEGEDLPSDNDDNDDNANL